MTNLVVFAPLAGLFAIPFLIAARVMWIACRTVVAQRRARRRRIERLEARYQARVAARTFRYDLEGASLDLVAEYFRPRRDRAHA